LPLVAWNGKAPTRPGKTSNVESNNMEVGLGEGLSVTLWGGESAVDPSIRRGHDESASIEHVGGIATTIDCWTAAG